MRYGLIVLLVLLCSVTSAAAQVSIGIGLPSVSIGINLPVFPELVVVSGYPVYYAPRLDANFFFYDGLYWVYQGDYCTRAPGTTGPGRLWRRRLCRCTSCESLCATTGIRLRTFARGGRMRRHAGGSTGGMNGSSVEADGTSGAAALLQRPPRCPSISGSIQGTGIPEWSSSRRFTARITVTSRRTP
jgi:hypothetical protein